MKNLLEDVVSAVLCCVYLIMSMCTGLATVQIALSTDRSGMFTGILMTILFLLPAADIFNKKIND